jgi:glycosyltransferase involved in cell wall biosynthesis
VLDEIEERFGSLGGRGEAIPHGVDRARFYPREATTVRSVLDRWQLEKPFLLHVGSLTPRRGLDTALAALALVDRDVELVIVGKTEHCWGDVPAALEPRVRRLGYVPDAELPVLMSAASTVLALSRGEGFDLPLLEALACGAPVVASDIPPHREHFAGLVDLVPVDDPDAVAVAVGRCRELGSPGERRARSTAVHRRFQWREAAAKHLEVWRQVGGRR